jgi:hypothetical protein
LEQNKMPKKTITSYEVLGQKIAPVPNVPYITQGAFLQISNLEANPARVDVLYTGTPPFVAASGAVSLFTNYIDQTGLANATSYPVAEFLAAPVGFKGLTIPGRSTWLFGVQYLLAPGAAVPAVGVDARGFIQLEAAHGSKLLVLATTRQVFTNFSADGPPGTVTDLAESAYAVPLFGGPEVTF